MNNKVIPYWYDLILALAQDFESEGITWKELYDRMFGIKTDINQTMTFTLQGLGVNHTDVINAKAIAEKAKNVTYEWEVIEDNDQNFVQITNTLEKGLINPKEKEGIQKAITRLGYRNANK